MVKEIKPNIHRIDLGTQSQIAMLSDLHWDNPKCDRFKLKTHLNYCKKNEIPIFVNGDFFCLMQGKGDKRSNKSDIRPEHNNSKYLDSVVDTAVEWFAPYAHLFTVLGYGNHETSIIKYQETDILARFVFKLNAKCGTDIKLGGYGGFLVISSKYSPNRGSKFTTVVKYFHGSGGGGPVTRGEINLTRALAKHEGFDVYTIGHIHENKATDIVRESLEFNVKTDYRVDHKAIHMMVTGTYKEEFGDGTKGWHVERGAPIKPIGGRILNINLFRHSRKGKDIQGKVITSTKFPI